MQCDTCYLYRILKEEKGFCTGMHVNNHERRISMKRRVLEQYLGYLIVILLLLITTGSAQEWSEDTSIASIDTYSYGEFWAKYFGSSGLDETYATAIASDGNYFVGGYTRGTGGVDAYVMKLNATGGIIWRSVFGGGGWDQVASIAPTSDGGCAVAGYGQSFGLGGHDAFIIKYNASGAMVWKKAYGGPADEGINKIIQTSDGGYIVAGQTESFGAGNYDVLVMKLNSSGNITWARTLGGANDDEGMSVYPTADGGYIVTGNTMSFGWGGPDFLVLKFNSIGSVHLKRTYGSGGFDKGTSIVQSADGNYIITGYTMGYGAGALDILVLKITTIGGVIWTRTYGGPKHEMSLSIANLPDAGFAIGGYTASYGFGQADLLMLRIDSIGRILRKRTFGYTGDEGIYELTPTPDGNYMAVGSSTSWGAGNYDNLIVKLNSAMEVPGCGRGTIPPLTVTAPTVKVTIPPLTIKAPAINVIVPGTTAQTTAITLSNICP
jgi:uncharacterized delta-60 repeat protein